MADTEETKKPTGTDSPESVANPTDSADSAIVEAGEVSTWLSEQGFAHELMKRDHAGVEVLKVDPEFLLPFATALYAYGFNYLRCQSAYDSRPRQRASQRIYDLTEND